MRETIFQSTQTMPPANNSPDVVRTALSMPERNKNALPAVTPVKDASVECVERPRRGHGY